MTQAYAHYVSSRQRKVCYFLLALFWLLGLLCGILTYCSVDVSSFPLMRSISHGTVSIVGLFCVSILPFLLSAFAVYVSVPVLILPMCFCKAFLFAFVSLGIMQLYGTAGWIICLLVLFSDYAVLPLLYWYWLCHFVEMRPFCIRKCIIILFAAAITGIINHCVISPFTANLIHF